MDAFVGQDSARGVASIEIVPPFVTPAVVTRLKNVISQARSVRGAIAYWCVEPNKVSADLVSRLSGSGFLCVDIHLPTQIDILHSMKVSGANVYLHLLDPNPQPGELKMKMPPYLMHSKMLLFDLPEGLAELWVGSHNWTVRALTGLNIEASLRLRVRTDSSVYQSTAAFLEAVQSSCLPYDLTAKNYYKWLQDLAADAEVNWVVELTGRDSVSLAGERVTIFEQFEEEYRNLKKVDKAILVSVLDPNTQSESLYRASILDTGHLERAGVDFEQRLYVRHTGPARPKIEGPAVPTAAVIGGLRYWATIALHEAMQDSYASYDLPPKENWIVHKGDSFEQRVDPRLRDLYSDPRRPLVRRPVPRAVFEGREPANERESLQVREYKEIELSRSARAPEDATERPEHPIIRKKVIRRLGK